MQFGLIALNMFKFNILNFNQLIKFSRLKLHDIKQWTILEIKEEITIYVD